MWKAYAKKHRLPWNPTGTFEIAVDESQVPRLETYYRWGRENGMRPDELELLTPEEVSKYEPRLRCHGAIWSKTDASVDFEQFTKSLRGDAETHGASFLMDSKVKTIEVRRDTLDIYLADRSEPIKAQFLVNCAGGSSIRVAHMLDVGREYADLNFRGEYWNVRENVAHLANHSIYSVPRHSEFPFLDPHWIIRADSRREIGPNAVPVGSAYTYKGVFNSPFEPIKKLFESPVRNKLSLLFNTEFLTLAGEEWRSSLSKSAMVHRVQEFLPELMVEHLTTHGTAGVRAAVIDRKGNFIKEAIELTGPLSYHITNYNSPGATGAPAYAAWVVSKLESNGYLDHLKAKPRQLSPLWDFDNVCDMVETL
jgi:L-2-hydroxyglutarate oxidase